MNGSRSPDGRAPCIIGVGQVVAHSSDPRDTEPLELWAEACALAVTDTAARQAITTLDSLSLVRCDSWDYDAPVQRLADRLGLPARHLADSDLGGAQPQLLLHLLGDAIAGGQMDLGLVVSGEALHTVDKRARDGAPLPWGAQAPVPAPVNLDDFFHESELRHGMLPIMRSFALRDTARRAHLGLAVQDYAREPAPIYAAMSELASANPYAWHPQAKSPEEILRVGPGNRMPVHPYPKFMMASPKVNQAAAVLVASDAKATELGVPPDRRVYLRGWSSARDYPYVAENDDLWRSRAMEAGVRHALHAAGLEADDVAHFDLYSCFPASVRFALDALGRTLGDGRGVTVTGGMPYAGAPGSGYVTHAIAAMAGTLRKGEGGAGLVSGLSAQMAKHAFTVLSTVPGAGDPKAFGSAIPLPASGERVVIQTVGRGPAVLEAYAVGCNLDGTDELAVAVCRLPDGSRCYAEARDTKLLGWLSMSEGVGRRVELVEGEGGVNRFVA